MPDPRGDQLLPSHLATPLSVATYKSLPDTASAALTCIIALGGPAPRADQLLPFHLAIRLAALPPAVVKLPAAYASLPEAASANTYATEPLLPPIPEPRADQLVPFHLAI